jgi:hypothetical protein
MMLVAQEYMTDLNCGTRKLHRFTVPTLGEMMTFVNVRGMWNKPLWRVEGKQNWQLLRKRYGTPPALVLGPNDEVIAVDLRGFR